MIKLLIDEDCYQLLTHSLNFVTHKYNACILGYVCMPNHIHLIVYFKETNRLSDLMRDFKKFTSGELRRLLEKKEEQKLVKQLHFEKREQKFKVWMDRFDDVYLVSRKILEVKLNYIHLNPVKENLATLPEDYKHSSACFYYDDTMPPVLVEHYLNYF